LFGISIAEVEHAVSAAILSPALATRLDAEKKSAALEILRSYRTSDGGIAQVTVNTHPASRHKHRLLMQRAKG
jgi:DNA-binding GntR family transcriptional regulator